MAAPGAHLGLRASVGGMRAQHGVLPPWLSCLGMAAAVAVATAMAAAAVGAAAAVRSGGSSGGSGSGSGTQDKDRDDALADVDNTTAGGLFTWIGRDAQRQRGEHEGVHLGTTRS